MSVVHETGYSERRAWRDVRTGRVDVSVVLELLSRHAQRGNGPPMLREVLRLDQAPKHAEAAEWTAEEQQVLRDRYASWLELREQLARGPGLSPSELVAEVGRMSTERRRLAIGILLGRDHAWLLQPEQRASSRLDGRAYGLLVTRLGLRVRSLAGNRKRMDENAAARRRRARS